MGNEQSRKATADLRPIRLDDKECFERRILLLRCPSVIKLPAELRLLHSMALTLVQWSGGTLPAEKWKDTLGNLEMVFYFLDPVADHDASAAKLELEKKIKIIDVVCKDVPITLVVTSKPPAQDFYQSLADTQNVVGILEACSAFQQFKLMCFATRPLVPLSLHNTLQTMLGQLCGCCGVPEAHLIDAASFLPVVSYWAYGEEDGRRTKHEDICFVLASKLGAVTRRAALEEMTLKIGDFNVHVGWACKPILYTVVVWSDVKSATVHSGGESSSRDTVGLSVGNEAFVRVGVGAFREHFTAVVMGTTRTRRHVPVIAEEYE